jgi:hypothetical protein
MMIGHHHAFIYSHLLSTWDFLFPSPFTPITLTSSYLLYLTSTWPKFYLNTYLTPTPTPAPGAGSPIKMGGKRPRVRGPQPMAEVPDIKFKVLVLITNPMSARHTGSEAKSKKCL